MADNTEDFNEENTSNDDSLERLLSQAESDEFESEEDIIDDEDEEDSPINTIPSNAYSEENKARSLIDISTLE